MTASGSQRVNMGTPFQIQATSIPQTDQIILTRPAISAKKNVQPQCKPRESKVGTWRFHFSLASEWASVRENKIYIRYRQERMRYVSHLILSWYRKMCKYQQATVCSQGEGGEHNYGNGIDNHPAI